MGVPAEIIICFCHCHVYMYINTNVHIHIHIQTQIDIFTQAQEPTRTKHVYILRSTGILQMIRPWAADFLGNNSKILVFPCNRPRLTPTLACYGLALVSRIEKIT